MKILEFDNSILNEYITETAILKTAVSAGGSNVALTLDDNSRLLDDDLVLVGVLGSIRTEKAAINDTVVAGTNIRVDSLKYAHSIGEPVQKILYDQIKIYHDTVITGATKTLIATVDISFDKAITSYADNDFTTGYAFFTLFNSVTSDESGLSVAIPYSSLTSSAKQKIRDLVKNFYTKDIDDNVFDMLLEAHEKEFFAKKPFKFREKTWTFNTEVGTQAYPFSSFNGDDLATILSMTYDTYPIDMIENDEFLERNAGTTASGISYGAFIWNKTIYLTPTPSEIKAVNVYGYKTPAGLTEETSETNIPIPQYLAFRILQDLFALFDTKKAGYFAGRADQIQKTIEKDDDKHYEQGTGFTKSSKPRRGLYGEFTIS